MSQLKTYSMPCLVTALTSIYHGGGQSVGIYSLLRRGRFVQPDGSVEEVPLISGNGMRGLLRDRGMTHMCRALGYGVESDDESIEVKGLSLAAFYFLFSGGALTKDTQRGLDIDLARKLREAIPLVGVFGGAMGNQIMPGKLKVGKMIPLCRETNHLLPKAYQGDYRSIWDYLDEEFYTRTDDEKDEHKRPVISPQVRSLIEASARQKRAKNDSLEPLDDVGQNQQMMYYVETFAAGMQFYWQIELDGVTDIEFEAFVTALAELKKMPYIGGKSNVGLGKIDFSFDDWLELENMVSREERAVGAPFGAQYAAHLQQNGEQIKTLLDEVF